MYCSYTKVTLRGLSSTCAFFDVYRRRELNESNFGSFLAQAASSVSLMEERMLKCKSLHGSLRHSPRDFFSLTITRLDVRDQPRWYYSNPHGTLLETSPYLCSIVTSDRNLRWSPIALLIFRYNSYSAGRVPLTLAKDYSWQGSRKDQTWYWVSLISDTTRHSWRVPSAFQQYSRSYTYLRSSRIRGLRNMHHAKVIMPKSGVKSAVRSI